MNESLQKKNYFGPNAIHGSIRTKYTCEKAKELAGEGKHQMANWIDDYFAITNSESHSCKQIHAANMRVEVSPKNCVGLPSAIAGKDCDFKDETGSYIDGKNYCELMGYHQTPRGKRRN